MNSEKKFLVKVSQVGSSDEMFTCDSRETGEKVLRNRTEKITEGWKFDATAETFGYLSEDEAEKWVDKFREDPFGPALEKLSDGRAFTSIIEINHYTDT